MVNSKCNIQFLIVTVWLKNMATFKNFEGVGKNMFHGKKYSTMRIKDGINQHHTEILKYNKTSITWTRVVKFIAAMRK